jgi:predicted DNA binding protein
MGFVGRLPCLGATATPLFSHCLRHRTDAIAPIQWWAAVIRARFRMALPEGIWVREVSTAFPGATLRLLTGVPKGDRALELGEVLADDPRPVADAIRSHPDVSAYDQLYVDDSRSIAQYEADEQALYEFLWASSLPPEFPIVVEDGEMEFDLTATREAFEAFGEALDRRGVQYELLTLVHTDERDSLLTERQAECLAVAHRKGYFEVPRECSLADVADELGVDTSSASETLRRATERVVGQFLLRRQ